MSLTSAIVAHTGFQVLAGRARRGGVACPPMPSPSVYQRSRRALDALRARFPFLLTLKVNRNLTSIGSPMVRRIFLYERVLRRRMRVIEILRGNSRVDFKALADAGLYSAFRDAEEARMAAGVKSDPAALRRMIERFDHELAEVVALNVSEGDLALRPSYRSPSRPAVSVIAEPTGPVPAEAAPAETPAETAGSTPMIERILDAVAKEYGVTPTDMLTLRVRNGARREARRVAMYTLWRFIPLFWEEIAWIFHMEDPIDAFQVVFEIRNQRRSDAEFRRRLERIERSISA